MAYHTQPRAKKADGSLSSLQVDSNGYLKVDVAAGDFTVTTNLSAGDIEIGAVELKNGASDDRALIDSSGNLHAHITDFTAVNTPTISLSNTLFADKGNVTLIDSAGTNKGQIDASGGVRTQSFQNDGTSLTDQSFTFAASDPQYTTKVLEFTAPTNKTQDFMVTVYNPSTENALKVQMKNMLASFNGITRPSKVDEMSVAAQPARVDPTYIQYFDSSGTSYASDLTDFTSATANDVLVPGHAEAEIDDALYIGYLNRFRKVYINLGTAKTDVSTLVWEYYNGAGWVALTDLQDGTVGMTATAGVYEVAFNPPIGWATTTVNSLTAYWIRLRCSAFTSAGTQGLITQGKIVDNYNADVFSQPVYGLFNGASKARLVISNQTAAVGATATVAGAGAFTGYIRITPLI